MTTTTPPAAPAQEVTPAQQAGLLLGQLAGYMATRIIDIGLASHLIEAIAADPDATPDALAARLDLDETFVAVWCRGALGAGLLDRHGDEYRLARHLDSLLLDPEHPGYVGGMYSVVGQPEMFGRFGERLRTGERTWWDETSTDWIAAVESTGRPFYTRLVPGGLAQVPGRGAVLEAGARVVDTACGSGVGVVRLATAYPSCTVTGVDGDAYSIERARRAVAEAGLADRVELVCSSLEELELAEPVDVVINNISMHECRDIDRVAARVWATLRPGGWFVISDFPFPPNDAGLRTVPGQLMSGIQFFEAQIDDQLLPRAAYDELLDRHGFCDRGFVELTPVHALTYGRRPMD